MHTLARKSARKSARKNNGRPRSLAWALVFALLAGLSGRAEGQNPSGTGGHSSSLVVKGSTEVSGYADTDHVFVASPSIAATVADEVAGWAVGGHYLVDVVSAASVDIVSTASSKWTEVRHAGSAEGSVKLGDFAVGASGVFSSEPDYLSFAGGGTLSLDLLEKNVTPFVGFSYAQDQVGRTGLPRELWRGKQTLSGQVGVTFVVDRSTIASLQGDAIAETGYLAKPYRYVPLFSPAAAASLGAGASITMVNAVRVDQRTAEQLPNARHRFAITSRVAHRLAGSTLRVDERAYADTWGMLASTTDFRFLFDVGRRLTLWPHVRFHAQSQASFWERAYQVLPSTNGALGIPTLRTGDRELSPLLTGTGGGGARLKLVDDLRRPWSLVLEIDGSYTRYLDALYLTERGAVFSTLAVEAEF
ncbi:MAG: DUF3570 domain-containing protein [Myxococcota bacterium]|nr:DUF3570 domain-containing protein [Myxococcota bacterium]